MARAHYIKKARKDYPEAGIHKGDAYWWWQFRHGPKHKSLHRPKESQLTQSPHKSDCFSILEDLEAITLEEVVGGLDLSEYADRIRELGEQAQESLDNMPYHLQEASSSGELLQSRVDAMEDWANELESIEVEIDDSDFFGYDPENEFGQSEEEWLEEQRQEKAQEILDEIQGVCPDIS